jgi:hypothetical protein
MTIINFPKTVSIPIAWCGRIKPCDRSLCSVVLCGGVSFHSFYVQPFSY